MGDWNLGPVNQSSGRYVLTMLPSSVIDVAGNALELTPPVGGSYSAEAVLVLHPPTNLPFNQRVISENTPTTTDILFGTLSVIDLDTVDSFVYSLVSGQGSADNNRFRIFGNELFIKQGEVLDFESQPTYAVRVRVTDSIGNSFERSLVLAVTNVNEAPVAVPGGPYNAVEGLPLQLNGNGTDPDLGQTLSYAWDFNFDGITFDVDSSLQSPSLTIPDNGTRTVALRITDNGVPPLSTIVSTIINVANANPVLTRNNATVSGLVGGLLKNSEPGATSWQIR